MCFPFDIGHRRKFSADIALKIRPRLIGSLIQPFLAKIVITYKEFNTVLAYA
jgi:hypothetical protein